MNGILQCLTIEILNEGLRVNFLGTHILNLVGPLLQKQVIVVKHLKELIRVLCKEIQLNAAELVEIIIGFALPWLVDLRRGLRDSQFQILFYHSTFEVIYVEDKLQ